jgi:4-hydroxy 2-oxovalerate aldolase
VLIVGAGPSVKHYNEGIIKYVEIHKPAVLELNVNRSIPSSLLTASVVSLEARAIFDILQYGKLDHPIILPMTRIGNLIGELIEELDIYDYGLAVETDTFEFLPTGCRLHLPYTACYALAVATQAGAKMINLVGFDGYSAGDPRQEEMNNLFRLYKKNEKSLPITSLTPSSYNVNKGSIYSPAFE